MTSGELVSLSDLAMLSDVNADDAVYACRKLVAVVFSRFCGCFFNCNNGSGFAVRHAQRSIAHFAALLLEDCAQKTLFGGKLGFSLRSYFSYENVAGLNLGSNADYAALVKICKSVLAHVGQVSCNLFSSQLGVARVDFVFFDVNRA